MLNALHCHLFVLLAYIARNFCAKLSIRLCVKDTVLIGRGQLCITRVTRTRPLRGCLRTLQVDRHGTIESFDTFF